MSKNTEELLSQSVPVLEGTALGTASYAITNLSKKLFVTCDDYVGTADQRNRLVNNTNPLLQNSLVFLPQTNEIFVNKNFYGASTQLIQEIHECLKNLVGVNVEDADGKLNATVFEVAEDSTVGAHINRIVAREIDELIKNTNIESGSDAKPLAENEAYVAITKSTDDVDKDIAFDGSATGNLDSLKWDLRIPVDGIGLINKDAVLTNSTKVIYVPKNHNYTIDGKNETTLNAEIWLVGTGDNGYVEYGAADGTLEGLVKSIKAANILSRFDATPFVKDGMVKAADYNEDTHILTITFNTTDHSDGSQVDGADNSTITVDFSKLVDFKTILLTDAAAKYLTLVREQDGDGHDVKLTIGVLTADEAKIDAAVAALNANLSGIETVTKQITDAAGVNHEYVEVTKYDAGQGWLNAPATTDGIADAQAVAQELRKRDLLEEQKLTNLENKLNAQDAVLQANIDKEEADRKQAIKDLDDKYANVVDALDYDETYVDGAKGAEADVPTYIKSTLKQVDGLVSFAQSINVTKIADTLADGVVDLSKVQPGIADTSDIAATIWGVEKAVDEFVTEQLDMLTKAINLWASEGTWSSDFKVDAI